MCRYECLDWYCMILGILTRLTREKLHVREGELLAACLLLTPRFLGCLQSFFLKVLVHIPWLEKEKEKLEVGSWEVEGEKMESFC